MGAWSPKWVPSQTNPGLGFPTASLKKAPLPRVNPTLKREKIKKNEKNAGD